MDQRDKPQQGDETELFEQYNDELMRVIGRLVTTSPEVVEEACAIAWMRFLTHQPDRDRNWRSWLVTVARREAWRLDAERFATVPIGPVDDREQTHAVAEPADPHDRYEERVGLAAAIEVLEQLPPRLRRIAFQRGLGLRYREIADVTGVSPTRVNQLVARANDRIYEIISHVPRDDLPPRGKRLYDLEREPPSWLLATLGRVPKSNDRRDSIATRLLAWRRAALAIDDYRALTGFSAADAALGSRPDDEQAARAFDVAQRAIDRLHAGRAASRGID